VQPVWLWKCLVKSTSRHYDSAGDIINRNLDVGRLEKAIAQADRRTEDGSPKLQRLGSGL